ncbi:MAG: hypothetical protein ACRELA_21305 [Candidatus Rokuibacteriota bacterium]
MKTRNGASVILILLVGAACATTPARPLRGEFDDIPVPAGLAYQPARSTVIESPSVVAARVVYRGRIEAESLAMTMRTALEANGWRHLSGTSGTKQGATQLFEKGGRSLQVRVWEGGLFDWYTYLELAASRATARATSATTK